VPVLGKRGVHKEVYDAGFHLVLKPFNLEHMYLFPKDLQVLDLTGAREEAAQEASVGKAAHIQTSDGFFVDVDVSILYNIVDPYLVFTRLGTGRLFETNGIIPKAEPVLKQTLGELTTEEFYNSPLRAAKAQQAEELLNRDLIPYGLKVDHVQEEYLKKLEDAKGEVNKMVADADGRFRQAQIEADAYYEKQQRIAAATEAEGIAEAKGITELNKALIGSGGEVMVKLKIAEALEGKRILLLPLAGSGTDIETTNINQLLETYGVRGLAGSDSNK
jgi:regulator of protease activity HflC (stomatin/prohibitin superfamily)